MLALNKISLLTLEWVDGL